MPTTTPNQSLFENHLLLKGLQRPHLPDEEYIARVLSAPVVGCTVDFILKRGDEFLLITRKGGYWPNARWFFGGEQRPDEIQIGALQRLANTEAAILSKDILNIHFSHCQDVFNPANEDEGKPAKHTLMHIYIIEVRKHFEPVLDSTSEDPRWHRNDEPLPDVPEIIKHALKEAGVWNNPAA